MWLSLVLCTSRVDSSPVDSSPVVTRLEPTRISHHIQLLVVLNDNGSVLDVFFSIRNIGAGLHGPWRQDVQILKRNVYSP